MNDRSTRARERLVAALRELEAAIDDEAEIALDLPIEMAPTNAPSSTSIDDLTALVDAVATGQVSTRHPRYFGPPHPSPSSIAVVARALAATFNPQLATRAHAPWAVDVEASLVADLGARFGFTRDAVEGSFTQGGAESNLTAIACAATSCLDGFAAHGARGLARSPMIYASTEAHATIARAARIAGFGDAGVRRVPVDAFGRMKVASLRAAIADDRATGAQPFLIVATVGTTAEGAIDPVEAIADVAEAHACWLHADCAWGGLLAFIGARSSLISSLARADSIAFDLHKAFAIPLGVGAFLTRRQGALHAAFAIEAGYMPRDRGADPYAHGLAWSRRFAGLELHALIGRVGWDGIAASLRRQIAVADHLRASLEAHGWRVVNETPLPNVCFVDASTDGASPSLSRVARDVVDRGSAWISVVKGANGRRSLRACIGNPATRAADVDALVTALDDARVRARS